MLEQLAELQLPAVAAHLRGLALSMPFATTQWFLCLFLNAVPPETAFRVWDLILCHHPASLFLAALALLAQCESNSFLEATEVGAAVYLLRSSSRSAFDADGLVAAATAFPVSVDEIERLRREWRRKTMEAMNARLRVRELVAAQESASTFGHAQARSLLLALEIDGAAGRAVGEDALLEALARVLPQHECATLLDFIRSSARGDANAPALAGKALRGAHVAVAVAILCDGPAAQRLRLCAQAFDGGSKGHLSRAELLDLCHTAFHAYYRQPPPPAEVEALCDAVFLAHDDGVSPPSPTEPTAPPAASVALHRFVDLARGQPALAQCFSALSKPLHTPRVVRTADGAAASAPASASSFETFMPLLLPMCAIRRKPPRATPAAAGRKMPGAPPPPNSPLPKWAASTATAIGDALTNGAVDGALAMMKVPLARNPLGRHFADADALALAMGERGLEPPALKLAIGIDCGAANLKAGKATFGGRCLHAVDNVLGPDPNPYQLALFMLGKACDALGFPPTTPVHCFGYNAPADAPSTPRCRSSTRRLPPRPRRSRFPTSRQRSASTISCRPPSAAAPARRRRAAPPAATASPRRCGTARGWRRRTRRWRGAMAST